MRLRPRRVQEKRDALFDRPLLDVGVGARREEVDDVGDLSLRVFHRGCECRVYEGVE